MASLISLGQVIVNESKRRQGSQYLCLLLISPLAKTSPRETVTHCSTPLRQRLGQFLTTLSQKETLLSSSTSFSRLIKEQTQKSTSSYEPGNPDKYMLDTVILMIPRSKATLVDQSGEGAVWDLQSSTKAYQKLVKNPSKREEKSGLYFPRLTGYKRKVGKAQDEATLRIEFSAPKLLFKNNLDELVDLDFERVVETLKDRLERMGVVISTKNLKEAGIRAVHYSKNIELEGGYTSRYVIGEIGKINLNRRLDLTRARYMNEGQSLYAYSVSNSVILYDKIADLRRSQKRSIDKDKTDHQTTLFSPLASAEILRFEVRLSQTRRMSSLLRELGFPEKPTFQDIFSIKKAKAVVLHYWGEMVKEDNLPLFSHSLGARDLLGQILLTKRNAKSKTAVYLTGLVLLAQDNGGMRELRETLSRRVHDRTWYRLVHDLREVSKDLVSLQRRDWYEQINIALEEYSPMRTAFLSKKYKL